MPGVYPFPEWEDVVHGYLVALYKRLGRPISAVLVASEMIVDAPESRLKLDDVKDALDSLEGKELIERSRWGYRPLEYSEALRQQLELEEVKPFTREYGEVSEAHLDKVWRGDMRELQKPEVGGKYGLYPIVQYSAEEKVWRGLTKEE